MFVPFESLPSTSRIWIFQSNRPFTDKEIELLNSRLHSFTEQWNVHGMPLNTSYRIAYNQFIVLAADESEQTASGCSIDSSVRALKAVEQALGLSLFDRTRVVFKNAEGCVTLPLSDVKENFLNGILKENTLTFNNLVKTKGELETEWLVPARDTWVRRYIPNPLVKVK
jgi:hypothetical protein